ncbi:MAG: hypothetical protein ACUVSW_09255 [Roseiflexus sp.]
MTIGAEELLPWLPDSIVGSIFLAMLGLGFLAIVLMSRSRWWAIIPGGVLLSVAATVALSEVLPEGAAGSVLFPGLAATFAVLALMRETPALRWRFIPAAVPGVIGVLLMTPALHLIGFPGPLALIIIGIALLYGSRHREISR